MPASINNFLSHALQREFFRYLIVGGIAFIVDAGVLFLLVSQFGMNYLLAAMLSFLTGTVTNYLISISWVFRYRAIQTESLEFGIFLLTGVLGLVISLGVMDILTGHFGLHYMLAKVVATLTALAFNYLSRKWVLFSRWKILRPQNNSN